MTPVAACATCYAIVSASAPSTNGTASLEARLERIECALAELAAAADKPKARVTAKKK